jgi:hypothetical protein
MARLVATITTWVPLGHRSFIRHTLEMTTTHNSRWEPLI